MVERLLCSVLMTFTHIVLVRIHRFSIKTLFALVTILRLFANPYVAVQPQNKVDAARQRYEVRL